MKLSFTTTALLLLGLSSSVLADGARIRGAVNRNRVLQNDKNNNKNNDVEEAVEENNNDKNNDKNNNNAVEDVEEEIVEEEMVEEVEEEQNQKNQDGEEDEEEAIDPENVSSSGSIMENRVCETVTMVEKRSIAFISTLGDKAKGSAECLADPVNGCPGGCCRVASAFFVCDATGGDAPILPCVCNSLTVDPTLTEIGDQIQQEEGGADLMDIVETAIATNSFSTLVDLLDAADLVDTLKSDGPFTVFAPLNTAFPSGDALEAFKMATDLETLASILTFHVVPGEIMAADLAEGVTVTTVEGTNLTFSVVGGPQVNNANIVATDIQTSNGIIHVLDAMLDPFAPTLDIVETAVAAGNFTTLVDLVATAGLVDTLQGSGPFTVFAPVDSAFPSGAALEELKANMDLATLASVLTYHVLPGKIMSTDLAEGLTVPTVQGSNVTFSLMSGAMINDANIVQADVETSNGVIHFIDTMLLPTTLPAAPMPPAPTDTAPANTTTGGMAEAPPPAASGVMDVVQTAVSDGSFTILSDLLMLAGLIPTLQQKGPFTIFAPTDFSFGREGIDVDAIRALPADQIAEILKYHVVPGTITGFDLMSGTTLTTLQGSDLVATLGEDGGLSINNASILQHDKVASNGIIHTINRVLMPPVV